MTSRGNSTTLPPPSVERPPAPIANAPRRSEPGAGGLAVVATGADAERVRTLCHAHGLLVPVIESLAVSHDATSIVLIGEPSVPASDRVVHVVSPALPDDALLELIRALAAGRVLVDLPAPPSTPTLQVEGAARPLASLTDRLAIESAAVAAITALTAADRAHCLFHDSRSGELWSEARRREHGDTRRAIGGLVGWAARTGHALHASPAGDDPRWLRELDDPDGKPQSRLLVQPVVGADHRVHAILVAVRRWRHADFTAAELDALAAFAALARASFEPTARATRPPLTAASASALVAAPRTTGDSRPPPLTARAISDSKPPPVRASDSKPPPVRAPAPAASAHEHASADAARAISDSKPPPVRVPATAGPAREHASEAAVSEQVSDAGPPAREHAPETAARANEHEHEHEAAARAIEAAARAISDSKPPPVRAPAPSAPAHEHAPDATASAAPAESSQPERTPRAATRDDSAPRTSHAATNDEHVQRTTRAATNDEHAQRTTHAATNGEHAQRTTRAATNGEHAQRTTRAATNGERAPRPLRARTANDASLARPHRATGEPRDIAVIANDADARRVQRIAKHARLELAVFSAIHDAPEVCQVVTVGETWSPEADHRVAYAARSTILDEQLADLLVALATGRAVVPIALLVPPHSIAEARRAQLAFARARTLAAATDLGAAEQIAIDSVRELLDSDRAYCLLVDATTGALWSEARRRAHGDERRAIAGIAGWAARTGHAVSVARASADPRWLGPIDDPDGDPNSQLLVQPLVHGDGRVLAVLIAVRRPRRAGFTDVDAALLARFGALVAPMFEHVAVEEQTRHMLGDEARAPTATRTAAPGQPTRDSEPRTDAPLAAGHPWSRWIFLAIGVLAGLLVGLLVR